MLAKLRQAIVIFALLTATIIAVQLVSVSIKKPYTITQDTHDDGEVLLLDKALNLQNKSNSIRFQQREMMGLSSRQTEMKIPTTEQPRQVLSNLKILARVLRTKLMR